MAGGSSADQSPKGQLQSTPTHPRRSSDFSVDQFTSASAFVLKAPNFVFVKLQSFTPDQQCSTACQLAQTRLARNGCVENEPLDFAMRNKRVHQPSARWWPMQKRHADRSAPTRAHSRFYTVQTGADPLAMETT